MLSSALTAQPVRPLRINSATVRVVNSISGTLDYPVSILSVGQYNLIGIKTLPGPRPRAIYYQPTEPVGMLNYWPNPSQGEMHLWCDTVLNQFATINDTVNLPQGYKMALRWVLAQLLMPEYGKKEPAIIEMVKENADKALAFIRRSNIRPQEPAQFDPAIIQSGRRNDAGWILSGGF